MTRYTKVYSSFLSRLDEVNILRRFALEKEKQDPIALRHEINALCRGSVVLLSSHVEAYIKEVGELALDSLTLKSVPRNNLSSRFFYHISKEILNELRDTSDPERIAEKVFVFLQNDLDYWSRNGPFPISIQSNQFNKGFSNPAFDKIKTYFNRFGYSQYQMDLTNELRSQYQTCTTMIDHMVNTRNKIAHGDPTASQTPTELKDMVTIVRKFCGATDTVFASWWKSRFCSIR